MPSLPRLALAAGVGYLAGMLPSADVAARVAGAGDIRSLGTGNPGAANAINELGAGFGVAVLVADVAKAAVAGVVGRAVAGDTGTYVAGTAAVAGHCYPATRGFDGGKGVAASVGQCATSFPAYLVPDLAVAAVTSVLPWWKQRAYGAIAVSAAAWVAASVLWWRKGWSNLWGPKPSIGLPLSAVASSAMILQRFEAKKGSVAAAQRVATDDPAVAAA